MLPLDSMLNKLDSMLNKLGMIVVKKKKREKISTDKPQGFAIYTFTLAKHANRPRKNQNPDSGFLRFICIITAKC